MIDNVKIFIQNSQTGEMFEAQNLCNNVKYESYLSGQPGRLTLTLYEDLKLKLTSGSKISMIVDGVPIFYGYIFIMGTDATETYKITAYDQMRYLKNEEEYVTQNLTASEIFTLICNQAQLKNEVKFKANFTCPARFHPNKTRYNIIEYGIQQELINSKNFCFVRDDYGTLIFSELQQEKTDLIIGDGSLLTSYQYEISIDKDTYNQIELVQEDEEAGVRRKWVTPHDINQDYWGTLKLIQKVDKDMNEAQMTQLAGNLLKVKNRETKTMRLNALGVKEIRAGSGFLLDIQRLGIKEWMWVESVTHTFAESLHLMQLEVFV